MEEELQEQPVKEEESRNPDGTFRKGFSGNIKGRPKGQSLKEYAREYFSKMTDEEKHNFLMGMSKDIIWKQAEGLPQQDITSGGEKLIPTPILPLKCQEESTLEPKKPEETSENPKEEASPGIKENTESNQLPKKPEENNQSTTPIIPLNIG